MFWPGLSMLGALAMLSPSAPPSFPAVEQLPSVKEFPDPLTNLAGKKVTTPEQWKRERRPELMELFKHYMYGQYPNVKVTISSKVLFENKMAFGGIGTLREIEVSVGIKNCPPFHVLLALPNARPQSGVPVFVGLNFSGNHTLVDDTHIRIPTAWMYDRYPGVKANKATEEGRGKLPNVWPLEEIVKAGYAVATVYSGDFDPDRKEVREGMRPYITPAPEGISPGDFPATIMCWAWGVHRIVDYVTTQPEINAQKIVAVGHSRLGKTVLLAAALDERIAVAIPHQAGCGGTAPSRHDNPKAESVKRINTSFPHWFAANFQKFNEDPTKLPFDQHSLLALCAPRPVLYSNATEDEWANPSGQFENLKRASPVYELLGVKGIEVEKQPEVGKLLDSRLGYWIRAGKHEMNREDWKVFIQYAGKWLK
jgi:dienelactone hydrolase